MKVSRIWWDSKWEEERKAKFIGELGDDLLRKAFLEIARQRYPLMGQSERELEEILESSMQVREHKRGTGGQWTWLRKPLKIQPLDKPTVPAMEQHAL